MRTRNDIANTMPSIKLPLLSASSKLYSVADREVRGFTFFLSIDSVSGAPSLLPETSDGFLALVKDAVHREPEQHIDSLASTIIGMWTKLGNNSKSVAIKGLTTKDRSLVDAVDARFSNNEKPQLIWPQLHPLEVHEAMNQLGQIDLFNTASILIARHILEHSCDPLTFVKNLKLLIDDNGLCVIEVPDSEALISKGDFSQIWEEHTIYLTRTTLSRLLIYAGFEILQLDACVSDGETVLTAIVRPSNRTLDRTLDALDVRVSTHFIDSFYSKLNMVKLRLEQIQQSKQILLFGANHVAATFLDLVGDSSCKPTLVLDDDPIKSGKIIGLHRTEVCDPHQISKNSPKHLFIAIAEGRSPALYNRLRTVFPSSAGHSIEQLSTFLMNATNDAH